jgi:nucleoside-diphosphate-sugar epimerase
MVYAKPTVELPITENTPQGNPFSDYAQHKEKCEAWLMKRFHKENFPVTIVRPSHTYSKLWIPNPISSAGYTFAARLEEGRPVYMHNSGENLWTLTATSDFAVGLAGLAGNEKAIGEAFHITSDEAMPWYKIYEEIVAAVGVEKPNIVKIPLEFICEHFPELICWLKGDKAEPAVFDNSKIKRFVPDFVCRKPFGEGIRESVNWMRAHPDQKKHNPKVDDYCDRVVAAWMEEGKKRRVFLADHAKRVTGSAERRGTEKE